MKGSSTLSPTFPRKYIPNSLDTEVGYLNVDGVENLSEIEGNNPDITNDTNKTASNSQAGNTLPASIFSSSGSANSLKSNIPFRMSHIEDGSLNRSALSPRPESLNGVILEKHQSVPNKPLNLTMSPHSDTSRWRVGTAPPRPNTNPNTHRVLEIDRNRIPKPPRDSTSSPKVKTSSSVTASPPSTPIPLPDWQWDPESQEQLLFEQRLCEDVYGVAVRKIGQSGKAQLRYVKCAVLGSCDEENTSSTKSVSSLVRSFSLRSKKSQKDSDEISDTDRLLSDIKRKALIWGKKRDQKLFLDQFISVRLGKTTDRTRRNPQPATRLLSLITKDASFDIEAPTQMDRDKFAKAFAKFLGVRVEEVDVEVPDPKDSIIATNTLETTSKLDVIDLKPPGDGLKSKSPSARGSKGSIVSEPQHSSSDIDGIPLSRNASEDDGGLDVNRSMNASSTATSNILQGKEFMTSGPIISGFSPELLQKDVKSAVSSLTGGNYDNDIVEELHQALEALKSELTESRTEAARAVKVAEQAIQSAENSNSKDWKGTVTHKAAEAAALAQKKTADAIAKQRLAEERLTGERKNAAFWRKQAEAAEEEAGVLQTRAAAAEVQRAAINEELQHERQRTMKLVEALKLRLDSVDIRNSEALQAAIDRNRALEVELSFHRKDQNLSENMEDEKEISPTAFKRKKLTILGKSKKKIPQSTETASLLSSDSTASDLFVPSKPLKRSERLPPEEVQKLHSEFSAMRTQFELLKLTTFEELKTLPESTKEFAKHANAAILSSQAEIAKLQQRLALESNTRRKLLHEVQDLRGTIRVYCRPKPFEQPDTRSLTGILSFPSNEILVLHRERLPSCNDCTPLSFKFDRIFSPDMEQKDLYDEVDELVLSALDGYNVCLMSFGQSGCGKTYSMLGDVKYTGNDSVELDDIGMHLLGMIQLFKVSKQRQDRYNDNFTLSIIEVTDEKLCDLSAGTPYGDAWGVIGDKKIETLDRKTNKSSKQSDDEAFSQLSSKSRKLEIRNSNDGEIIVQGVLSVQVSDYNDVMELWKQALHRRWKRIQDQGSDLAGHNAASHIIATLRVVSTNIATGVGTQGKIQFVDFASSHLIPQSNSVKPKSTKGNGDVLSAVGNQYDWKFANKSLSVFSDVISARSQYARDIPYRNSTISHLLQDSLEADTKVMMLFCVSANPKDIQQTASALKLAAKARKVLIGKATKHVKQV